MNAVTTAHSKHELQVSKDEEKYEYIGKHIATFSLQFNLIGTILQYFFYVSL
jgi:hypothetical protein